MRTKQNCLYFVHLGLRRPGVGAYCRLARLLIVVQVMITTSLKRAAVELRLITCCYLGASGYEGNLCVSVCVVCSGCGVVDEREEETT
jgi:hypothetical protein